MRNKMLAASVLPPRRNFLEDGRPVEPDPQDAVHEVALALEDGDGLANDPELLVPKEIPVLNQDDAGMKLARSGELQEVVYVAGHEDAVVAVRSFEDDMIVCLEEPPVADVNGVEPVLAERLGDPG